LLPRNSLWVPRKAPFAITRREFLYLTGAAALAAACGNGGGETTTSAGAGTTTSLAATGEEPAVSFVEPREQLSGELKILLWSHFVPAHDTWFDPAIREKRSRPSVTRSYAASGATRPGRSSRPSTEFQLQS